MATDGIYWFDDSGNAIEFEYSTSSTGSPLVFVALAEVKAISRNAAASDEIDFTHYGSTRKELRLGLPNDGTWEITCNFLPLDSGHSDIIGLGESKDLRFYRIRYPKSDTTSSNRCTETFSGVIETYGINPPAADGTTPVDLVFTVKGAGYYLFTPESA